MPPTLRPRRAILAGGATLASAALISGATPLRAQGVAATPTMRGGDNNYLPGAPLRPRIGGGGFRLGGTVRRAGDGAPLPGIRIQMWAHTTEGHERDPHSHGAILTDANGAFLMDMPQIIPAFGQAHAHLAYDAAHDGHGFETVFLRPVLRSARDTSLNADFILRRA